MPSRAELEARDEAEILRGLGAIPIANALPRTRVRVAGVVVALTYPPASEHPRLTARIHDGTGAISLVFVGRRDLPGLGPGRRLVAEGMVSEQDGQTVIHSPRYELLPGAGE